jgi:predicted SAM-dependent methyltransferase
MASVKLHIGCGKRSLPGFAHIDLADFPHIDYRQPAELLPMFAEASVDLIYASHILQYYDQEEVTAVLAEWRRVLKPGGLLRLAVPDLAALVEVYGRAGSPRAILGPLYGRMVIRSGGAERVIYHRTVYDFASLEAVLRQGGFDDVRRYDWRQTVHRDHDEFSQAYFPHMDKEHGLLISLNVEAARR